MSVFHRKRAFLLFTLIFAAITIKSVKGIIHEPLEISQGSQIKFSLIPKMTVAVINKLQLPLSV